MRNTALMVTVAITLGAISNLIPFVLMVPVAHAGEEAIPMVRVPDITGGASGCVIDVDAILKPLGLKSKGIAVHGPVDPDAKDIGCAYRQSPKPGTMVKKGTVIRYRSWWEAEQ